MMMMRVQLMGIVLVMLFPLSLGDRVQAEDLPVTVNQLEKVFGKPDQRTDKSITYTDKLIVARTDSGIDICFNPRNEHAPFYLIGLYEHPLSPFTKEEGDEITDMLDAIGETKTIGRFDVTVSESTQPWKWRTISVGLKK